MTCVLNELVARVPPQVSSGPLNNGKVVYSNSPLDEELTEANYVARVDDVHVYPTSCSQQLPKLEEPREVAFDPEEIMILRRRAPPCPFFIARLLDGCRPTTRGLVGVRSNHLA